MIFWLLAALITAGAVVWVANPLAKAGYRWLPFLLAVIPLMALALYYWLGRPDLLN